MGMPSVPVWHILHSALCTSAALREDALGFVMLHALTDAPLCTQVSAHQAQGRLGSPSVGSHRPMRASRAAASGESGLGWVLARCACSASNAWNCAGGMRALAPAGMPASTSGRMTPWGPSNVLGSTPEGADAGAPA